ncbi:hypothetical protein ACH5RR_005770 [Cinchona calisaya]|uniref:Methyltransferase type 11 domain-containing protein n=1 Tax=Cinchona calisaya TaxID=153742 RepID=A0ABD3AME7_9GENT
MRFSMRNMFSNVEARTLSKEGSEVDFFACPVCYEPLVRKGPSGFNLPAIYRSGFKCKTCKKTFSRKNLYLDLIVTAGSKDYNEFKPAGTGLCRFGYATISGVHLFPSCMREAGIKILTVVVSLVLMKSSRWHESIFQPVEGGILVDVSRGSGLFSRKFAKSGAYSRVVALDFSENMLYVSRLPFSSGSIDCVHAGAALHCWPSPSNAVAEINRIL